MIIYFYLQVNEPPVFDPFSSGETPTKPGKAPEPFLKPTDTASSMASPMIPLRLDKSSTNSPAISRSNTPHASPSLPRKSAVNDPFSDLIINTKTAEVYVKYH